MKILRLGSSIDVQGETPVELRAGAIAEGMLAEACGERVETILRLPRPGPSLSDAIERWLDETDPDFVCFNISSHWCESENVARRLGDLGPVGRFFARILDRATESYRVNANPFTRAGRLLAAYTVGGRPPFQPGEAATLIEDALRRIVRREGVAVVVAGSPFSASLEGGGPARRRAQRRRAEFYGRLAATCELLHIPYELPPHAPDAFDKRLRTRDGLHFGPEMHKRCGEMQGQLLVSAWRASQVENSVSAG